MQIKKLFKYLTITVIVTGLAIVTSAASLPLINNPHHLKNQSFNADSQVNDADYSNQLEYIRKDVEKQTGVSDSVTSINLVDSSSSSNYSAALVTKTDGSTLLYMWGDNRYGQLGNRTTDITPNPTLIYSKNLDNKKITDVILGESHSAAVLEDGSLYMWGRNDYGQLGNGLTSDTTIPIKTTINSASPIKQIALGQFHSAALLEDGSLFMWGRNNYGQLGFTANTAANHTPIKVTINSTSTIDKIALGNEHSAAVLKDGSLYMWGINDYGQLGFTANSTPNPKPAKVTIPNSGSKKIDKIALGAFHSAATLEDNTLYMWGWNNYGQLGNDLSQKTPIPTKVTINSTSPISKISLAFVHSAALLADGSLYMWGQNQYGQLGDGSLKNTHIPTRATIDSTSPITRIALGYQYSAGLLEDGSLYMWGYNYYGQLGNGTKTNMSTPTLSSLGKDSYITANAAITAQTAVDSTWVDDKFNLTGFKNSFNLINIPETTDQKITMDTKPTYDNATGTVTMNVKIKYFYNADGLLVPDSAAEEMTITGFAPPVPEEQSPFPWWWIIIGIGGSTVIGLGVWLFIKKHYSGYSRSLKRKYKSRKYR